MWCLLWCVVECCEVLVVGCVELFFVVCLLLVLVCVILCSVIGFWLFLCIWKVVYVC